MPLVGNTLAYILIAAGFLALIVLNPGQEQHQRAFMDHAHAHFFELPRGYREVYEKLRDDTLRAKATDQLRYGNFLLFSTLSHTAQIRLPAGGFRPERRPLTFGALGFVWPVTMEPSAPARPALDQ
jgi:hypothetical protein